MQNPCKDIPEWSEWFMDHAKLAATKSKDSTKVGAALICDGSVVLTAFNGPPRGVRDTAARSDRPRKYLFAAHAEANLVSVAARLGIRTDGCGVYTTHHPCAACARSLIQAGIKWVVFGDGSFQALEAEKGPVAEMFDEAGVGLMHISADFF